MSTETVFCFGETYQPKRLLHVHFSSVVMDAEEALALWSWIQQQEEDKARSYIHTSHMNDAICGRFSASSGDTITAMIHS